jgi:peroxiredoxin
MSTLGLRMKQKEDKKRNDNLRQQEFVKAEEERALRLAKAKQRTQLPVAEWSVDDVRVCLCSLPSCSNHPSSVMSTLAKSVSLETLVSRTRFCFSRTHTRSLILSNFRALKTLELVSLSLEIPTVRLPCPSYPLFYPFLRFLSGLSVVGAGERIQCNGVLPRERGARIGSPGLGCV